jgi:hypothetical protein
LQHLAKIRACTRSSAPRSHGLGTKAWKPRNAAAHGLSSQSHASTWRGLQPLWLWIAPGFTVSGSLRHECLSTSHRCSSTENGFSSSYSVICPSGPVPMPSIQARCGSNELVTRLLCSDADHGAKPPHSSQSRVATGGWRLRVVCSPQN